MPHHIALLIDAENISYQDLPQILEEVPRYGKIVLKAIYGNWSAPHLQRWREYAEAHNFKIRQHTHVENSKNSSDMKLIMDAMQILYQTKVDTFCLVTNDTDYVPLVEKIRDEKRFVIVAGYEHVSTALLGKCHYFITLVHEQSVTEPEAEVLPEEEAQSEDVLPLKEADKPSPAPVTHNKNGSISDVIVDAFMQADPVSNNWIKLSIIGDMLHQHNPNFKAQHYKNKTLSHLLGTFPGLFEVKTESGTNFGRIKNHRPVNANQEKKLRKLIRAAFNQVNVRNGHWVKLSTLGTILRQISPDYKPSQFGYKKLSDLLADLPDLVELDRKGSARLK